MNSPLLIAGRALEPGTHSGTPIFYPGYTYHVASAGLLEAAQATGAARSAERLSFPERVLALQRAAEAFTYLPEQVEHTVRVTGMPISLVAGLFEEIPTILRSVPEQLKARFRWVGPQEPGPAEAIGPGLVKVYQPVEGFCYAITPGNDPRAAAIVAANLCSLGIPFVLRASNRDALAPALLRALIAGGFDARFCSLVYFDRNDPLAKQAHFKLVDACSIVWTFGPADVIDQTLRYAEASPGENPDLTGLEPDFEDASAPQAGPVEMQPQPMLERTKWRRDHFAGKIVLRHASGNCAAVVRGSLSEALRRDLYASIGYPLACTSTKSIMWIEGEGCLEQTADFLADLALGDPLDPQTQIGYIEPRVLDTLQEVVARNRLHLSFYGGERRSPIQAAPLLVASQEQVPDLFGQEIPAYVLSVRPCGRLSEAVEAINACTGPQPRLAVSFFNIPKEELPGALLKVRAHTVLVDKPTTTLLPAIHEGNDYALQLQTGRLMVL